MIGPNGKGHDFTRKTIAFQAWHLSWYHHAKALDAPRGFSKLAMPSNTVRPGSTREATAQAVVTLGCRVTRAPISTRSYRSLTCSLVSRAQPFDTALPMVEGALVPWMRR